jgi:hypothetical protein
MRKLSYLVLYSLMACALLVSTAQAKIVTVGSPLSAGFSAFPVGEGASILINSELGENGANVYSPVDGAIVGWKVEGEGGPFSLRVMKPEGAGTFRATSSSEPHSLASLEVGSFSADIPVSAGDGIGLQPGPSTDRVAIAPVTGSAFAAWSVPPVATPTAPYPGGANSEVGFNAEILPAPRITGVAPAVGPATGGTPVVVTGIDFTDVSSVGFGGAPAAAFTVNSESQITAVAPASAAVAVAVSVTTVAGTATSGQPFVYQAPAGASQPAPTPTGGARCTVPNLTGKRLKAAKKKIRAADCKVGKITKRRGATAKTGKIVGQSKKPGAVLPAGSVVKVTLGKA